MNITKLRLPCPRCQTVQTKCLVGGFEAISSYFLACLSLKLFVGSSWPVFILCEGL